MVMQPMSAPRPPNEIQGSDPATWVDRYGDVLYRHALSRVGRCDVAEDLVQETFLAALKARDRFSGQSLESTWLLGILKRKIVDHYRKARSTQSVGEEIVSLLEFFRKNGHWKANLPKWPSDPQQDLEDREFWQVLQHCKSELPESLAAAFTLRELEQLETRETCTALGISPSNLSVRLHRARLLLRRCLERNWFSG